MAAHQQNELDAVTAILQKVSAQPAEASPSGRGLEMNKFAIGECAVVNPYRKQA